jgi:hypothetical protein
VAEIDQNTINQLDAQWHPCKTPTATFHEKLQTLPPRLLQLAIEAMKAHPVSEGAARHYGSVAALLAHRIYLARLARGSRQHSLIGSAQQSIHGVSQSFATIYVEQLLTRQSS